MQRSGGVVAIKLQNNSFHFLFHYPNITLIYGTTFGNYLRPRVRFPVEGPFRVSALLELRALSSRVSPQNHEAIRNMTQYNPNIL